MSFDRADIGGWLNGPEAEEGSWPGRDLGYPREGHGSIASFLRRAGALLLDWLACLAVSNVFFGGDQLATLLIFALEQVILVGLLGTSLGHRIFGIRVADVQGTTTPQPLASAPFFVRAAVRSLLLTLFVPAILMNSDLRGINDRLAGTVVLRA